MSTAPMIRRRTVVASALGLAALTACTDTGGEGGGGGAASASDGGGSPAASDGGGAGSSAAALFPDAVATATIQEGQDELTIGVRPVIRSEGRLVLTLDLHLEGPDDTVPESLAASVADLWRIPFPPHLEQGDLRGVRLLDLEGGRVAGPSLDVEQNTVVIAGEPVDESVEARRRGALQIAYGDLGTSTAALFLPRAGLLPDLPVADGEVPTVENAPRQLDVLTADMSPVTPMITRAFDLLAPLREENDGETSTVSIGSDVLFDSSSFELTGDAAQVLDVAATRIMAHEPGEVTVEGHTDDVGEDQPNQELSQARAEAVAAALGERIDTDQYPLTTVGRGETEPIAANDGDAGRARNRRVELTISTPMREDAGGDATRAPFDGLGATGEEGVEFELVLRPFRLRAPGARIVAGHLVVTLEAVYADDEVDGNGLVGLTDLPVGSALDTFEDEYELSSSLGAVGVLGGSLLTLPVMHRLSEDESSLLYPMTPLHTYGPAAGGTPITYELVYPRGLTGVEPGGTVAVQMGTDGFRLTDIPVAS